MNVIDHLINFYNATPEGDIYHDAILHLLGNLEVVRHYTIYQLADECFVSPSTISRLCRKLNYDNYTAFKDDIIHVLDNYNYYNRIVPPFMVNDSKDEIDILLDTVEAATRRLRMIDKKVFIELADVLHSKQCVGLYTYGGNSIGLFLLNSLVVTGHKIRPHYGRSDLRDTRGYSAEDAVIFIYPYFKETAYLTTALKECAKTETTVILVTSQAPEQLYDYANYYYDFGGALTIMDNYERDLFLNMLTITYRKKYIDIE